MMPIHNRKGWVLGSCVICGRLNYVEPHGTTAKCKCGPEWTEHKPIPNFRRDISGMFYDGPSRIIERAQPRWGFRKIER